MLNDIETRADIELCMRAFYTTVLQDEALAPKFADMDLEEHLPVITDFWQSTILGGVLYTNSPFPPHRILNLDNSHFELWMTHFVDTVTGLYSGAHTDQILAKARSVAAMFRFQLGLMNG